MGLSHFLLIRGGKMMKSRMAAVVDQSEMNSKHRFGTDRSASACSAPTHNPSQDAREKGPYERVIPPVCILGEAQVHQLTNLSRTTRWRIERRGEFPKRVRLSPGRVGWRQDEIREWIDSRSPAMPSPTEMQQ